MSEKADTLAQCQCLLIGDEHIAPLDKFRDSFGNAVIEATVQRPEFLHGKLLVQRHGKIADSLAQVAIIVHHLADGIAERQQFPAVRAGAVGQFRCTRRTAVGGAGNGQALRHLARLLRLQGADQLIEEDGYAFP